VFLQNFPDLIKMPMRLPFTVFPSVSTLSRACCLLAAIALVGCATKNPLMEEPVAAAPAAPATQAAQSQPAKTAEQAATGVQTTKEKRLFGIFSPYRIDIQQGNFISQEQLTQLKTGMTADQVKFVLGTPLLNDIFHANRWDYVFRLQKGSGEAISSRITVFFEDNRVARIDAGTLPNERDFLSLIAGPVPAAQKADTPKTETPTK
jgi:outer membrane protein assembly factor BamE